MVYVEKKGREGTKKGGWGERERLAGFAEHRRVSRSTEGGSAPRSSLATCPSSCAVPHLPQHLAKARKTGSWPTCSLGAQLLNPLSAGGVSLQHPHLAWQSVWS